MLNWQSKAVVLELANLHKLTLRTVKETKSATMNIFRKFLFLFKTFVKVDFHNKSAHYS